MARRTSAVVARSGLGCRLAGVEQPLVGGGDEPDGSYPEVREATGEGEADCGEDETHRIADERETVRSLGS